MASIDEIAERAARDIRADVRSVVRVHAGLEAIVGGSGHGRSSESSPLLRRRWVMAVSLAAAAVALVAVVLVRNSPHSRIVPATNPPMQSTLPSNSTTDATETPSLQEAILADGVVTDAEFNSANQAAAECIRRLGFDALVLPGGGIRTSYQEGQSDDLDAAQYSCETQYNTQVQLRYSIGHLSPELDVEAIWDCLEERGIVDRKANDDPVEAFQLADAANSAATSECIKKGRGG